MGSDDVGGKELGLERQVAATHVRAGGHRGLAQVEGVHKKCKRRPPH
jgi:hypothetical protein